MTPAGKGKVMGKTDTEKDSADEMEITFTVAECGEYHGLGEYHEDIRTLEEAADIYRKIPPERVHGIPSIGIKLHEEGNQWDIQVDILTGGGIDIGMVKLMPELCENPKMQGIIKEMIRMFPEKEVIDL